MLIELGTPDAAAIPVAAFSAHLRLGSGFADDHSEDAALETYLRAALAAVEARTGLVLLARRFRWTLTRWADEAAQVFPVAPVQELESVTLRDRLGTVLPATDWVFRQDNRRPVLRGAGSLLPVMPGDGSAEVVFTGGFGSDWDAVPQDLRQAVFLIAADYYEQRSASESGLPLAALSLLLPWRDLRLGVRR